MTTIYSDLGRSLQKLQEESREMIKDTPETEDLSTAPQAPMPKRTRGIYEQSTVPNSTIPAFRCM